MKKESKIKIIASIGELPRDPDLKRRIEQLPKDATISNVFREVSKWEKEALKNFRDMEKTKKSGRLHPICPPREELK